MSRPLGHVVRSDTSICAGLRHCGLTCRSDYTPHPYSVTRESADPGEFTGVVALDGPSGTGKSTVARRLAERLGVRYLDTGAMYRAATVAVLRAGIVADAGDPDSAVAITKSVEEAHIELSTDPDNVAVTLG